MAPRLVLDSSAVIGLVRRDARAVLHVKRAVELGAEICIPAPVVAETVRGDGPRDAAVNRVIAAADTVPAATEAVARVAGSLLARSSSDATLDALVAAEATRVRPTVLLTSDIDDMKKLLAGTPGVIVARL